MISSLFDTEVEGEFVTGKKINMTSYKKLFKYLNAPVTIQKSVHAFTYDEIRQMSFHAKVTGELGERIGTLRTDNGGEYTSDEFEEYLIKHNINHETTIADKWVMTYLRLMNKNPALRGCANPRLGLV